MASSKSYLLLFCALLALVLLVSAEVTTSHDAKEASDKNAKVDHHGGPGYGGYPGGVDAVKRCGCRHGCCRCCTSANEAPDANIGEAKARCRCRHSCCRCCTSANEAPDADIRN